MPVWIINTLIVIGAFTAMECIAWLAHKYLMHGALWFLHHDHHQRDDGDFFEKMITSLSFSRHQALPVSVSV